MAHRNDNRMPVTKQSLYPFSILLILLLVLPLGLLAQKKVKVTLQSANTMEYRKAMGPDLKRLLGEVVFEHDGALLYCDSAYFYEEENSLEAYGKIRIKISDTLNLYGDYLQYDGDSRVADIVDNVKLVDKQTTLTTDHLVYDRNTNEAFYQDGAVITNKNNKLTSTKGYYFTSLKQFFFKDKVVLSNPKYKMYCDTLLYETVSRVSYFKGPTRIVGKDNFMYCENGWYNTISDISQFNKNAYIKNEGQVLKGDSLYYDREKGIGKAFQNVSIFDSVQNVTITGECGHYEKKLGYSLVTDSAMAMLVDKKDTLFVHADTLYATFDENQETKTVLAYHKAKFFRKDLQGMSDTLFYNMLDSTITFFCKPIIWFEDNQLTADSIRLWITYNKADTMMLYNSSFIVSKADTGKYNQIKGRNMTAYFHENELYKVKVNGNAKTLYFAREDNGDKIGVNIAASSDMVVSVKDRKISRIKYLNKPDATLYPEKDLPEKDLLLPGFEWFGERRPRNAKAIFSW